MPININEMSLTVTGNIVKNNDDDGNSTLRGTQEQFLEVYNDLGDFFAKNGDSAAKAKDPVAPSNKLVESNSPSV